MFLNLEIKFKVIWDSKVYLELQKQWFRYCEEDIKMRKTMWFAKDWLNWKLQNIWRKIVMYPKYSNINLTFWP